MERSRASSFLRPSAARLGALVLALAALAGCTDKPGAAKEDPPPACESPLVECATGCCDPTAVGSVRFALDWTSSPATPADHVLTVEIGQLSVTGSPNESELLLAGVAPGPQVFEARLADGAGTVERVAKGIVTVIANDVVDLGITDADPWWDGAELVIEQVLVGDVVLATGDSLDLVASVRDEWDSYMLLSSGSIDWATSAPGVVSLDGSLAQALGYGYSVVSANLLESQLWAYEPVRVPDPDAAAPIAALTAPASVEARRFGTLDATDTSGVGLAFRFDFDGDGWWDTRLGPAPTATGQYTTPGTYPATVQVVSSSGQVDEASATVEVLAVPAGAVRVYLHDPWDNDVSTGTLAVNGLFQVYVDVINATNTDVTWELSASSGYITSAPDTATYWAEGSPGTVRLVARSVQDSTQTATVELRVGNSAPFAGFEIVRGASGSDADGPLQYLLRATYQVYGFDDWNSSDPEGSSLQYAWFVQSGFVDPPADGASTPGGSYTELTPGTYPDYCSYVPESDGQFTALLRVTDGAGMTGWGAQRFVVAGPGGPAYGTWKSLPGGCPAYYAVGTCPSGSGLCAGSYRKCDGAAATDLNLYDAFVYDETDATRVYTDGTKTQQTAGFTLGPDGKLWSWGPFYGWQPTYATKVVETPVWE